MSHDFCPLCTNIADVEHLEASGVWRVSCSRCGRFSIDEHLWDLFGRARAANDRRIVGRLPDLIKQMQRLIAEGSFVTLTADNWLAIAHEPPGSREG